MHDEGRSQKLRLHNSQMIHELKGNYNNKYVNPYINGNDTANSNIYMECVCILNHQYCLLSGRIVLFLQWKSYENLVFGN